MMSVVDMLVTSMKPLLCRSTPGLLQVRAGVGRPVTLMNSRREPPARKQMVFFRSSWSSKSGGSVYQGIVKESLLNVNKSYPTVLVLKTENKGEIKFAMDCEFIYM